MCARVRVCACARVRVCVCLVLLAADSAVVRMYSNGTTEVIVGDINTEGCVLFNVVIQ